MCHRQHCDDRDCENDEREDRATYGKAALIFGHAGVSYGWSETRGERADSGFVMINGGFSHLQIASNAFAVIAAGAAQFAALSQGLQSLFTRASTPYDRRPRKGRDYRSAIFVIWLTSNLGAPIASSGTLFAQIPACSLVEWPCRRAPQRLGQEGL